MQSEEIDEAKNNLDTASNNPEMTYTEKGESLSPRLKPHIIITEETK